MFLLEGFVRPLGLYGRCEQFASMVAEVFLRISNTLFKDRPWINLEKVSIFVQNVFLNLPRDGITTFYSNRTQHGS